MNQTPILKLSGVDVKIFFRGPVFPLHPAEKEALCAVKNCGTAHRQRAGKKNEAESILSLTKVSIFDK
jgi:hypothetical protein